MEIRDAHLDDADTLSDIAFVSKALWGYSDDFMRACRKELQVLPADIKSASAIYRVCEVQGVAIGFYALDHIAEDTADLDALFVHPDHVQRGIGKRLMQDAIDVARERGYSRLVIQSDPNAERFYLACGAVRVGQKESDSIAGRFLPLLEMD